VRFEHVVSKDLRYAGPKLIDVIGLEKLKRLPVDIQHPDSPGAFCDAQDIIPQEMRGCR
jgi:hypothetical protein